MFSYTVRTVAVFLALLLGAATGAQAQTLAGALPAPVDSEWDVRIESLLTRASALMADVKFASARPLFRTAAEMQLQAGTLPTLALRDLAAAWFYDRQPARAAMVLEELAQHAGRHGDLVVQATAYLDAAWLRLRVGDHSGVRARLHDVRLLLHSPYLPDEERQRLEARIR